jgi:hypothetical protein
MREGNPATGEDTAEQRPVLSVGGAQAVLCDMQRYPVLQMGVLAK